MVPQLFPEKGSTARNLDVAFWNGFLESVHLYFVVQATTKHTLPENDRLLEGEGKTEMPI